MPDFPKTSVLTGMVQAFKTDPTDLTAPWFTTDISTTDSYEFDIISGSRQLANFRNPDSVAGVQAVTSRTRKKVQMLTMREKKILKTSTTKWFDGPGQKYPEAAQRAVAREMEDLDGVIQRRWQWARWRLLLTGTFTATYDGGSMVYDFGLTNTATASVGWSTIATSDPIGDLMLWKRLAGIAAGEPMTEVILGQSAVDFIFKSTKALAQMSELTIDKYRETGKVARLADMDVTICDGGYRNSSDVHQYWLSSAGTTQNMALLKAAGPVGKFVSGPACDDEAPDGLIGKFAKTWTEKDPSGRWVLETQTAVPGLEQPNKIFAATLY